jgi:hypothetical protein
MYFYCRNGDAVRDSFIAFSRALIKQILQQETDLLQYVYHECALSGERPLCSIKRAQTLLETCMKNLKNIYIVIDGIDECQPEEKRKIVSWVNSITRLLQDDGNKFRCLFSCQSDEETSNLFKNIPTVQVKGAGIAQDIQNFCIVEGKNLQTKFSLTNEQIDDIVGKVSHRAEGISTKGISLFCRKRWLTLQRYVSIRKTSHASPSESNETHSFAEGIAA